MSHSCAGSQFQSSVTSSALRQGKYSFPRSDGALHKSQQSSGRSHQSGASNESATRIPVWNSKVVSDGENSASPTSIAAPISSHGPVPEICIPEIDTGTDLSEATPQRGDITASGPIHSRTTSIICRKWKPAYWAHVHPTNLVVFHSYDDFQEWRQVTYTTTRESILAAGWDGSNDKLVKLCIDFDPMGILRKKEKKERRRKEKEARKQHQLRDGGGGDGLDYPRKKKDKGNNKKDKKCGKEAEKAAAVAAAGASHVIKYAMSDVRTKSSGRDGLMLHTFKIEKWTQNGTSVAASFASSDPLEVKELRRVVRESINLTSMDKAKSKKSGKQEMAHAKSNLDASFMSDMTGMNISAASADSRKMKKLEGETGIPNSKLLSDSWSAMSGASTAFHSSCENVSEGGGMVRHRPRRGRRFGRPVSSNLSSGM